MSKNFYITTPIYYVNDLPHIGHAYTSIAADCLARFNRINNNKVLFATGTDEHGQKVEKSASLKKQSPKEYVDNISQYFKDLTKKFNISSDIFVRTTDKNHINSVKNFWNNIEKAGYIYLSKYSGWYSVRDEAFYSKNDIKDGKAPNGSPVEWVEEDSYFFALSKFQDKLLDFYEQNPDFIKPVSRRNEVISFVKKGLQDLSISRTSFKWGIEVPNNNKHVIYVWMDALTNYISNLNYPDTNSSDFNKNWPCDLHIVGKDILIFHAVYWIAFLMAANLALPKQIIAHGWWTNEGEKISKSLKNVIDPFKLIDEYGIDQVRYFLLREITFGNDGDFSKIALKNRVNSELSNKIGNLFQRTISFIVNYNLSKEIIPKNHEDLLEIYKSDLIKKALKTKDNYTKFMDNHNFSNSIEEVISLVNDANQYIDNSKPWELIKNNHKKLYTTLYILVEVLRYIAILLYPFIPSSADKLLDQINTPLNLRKINNLSIDFAYDNNELLKKPTPIFNRIK